MFQGYFKANSGLFVARLQQIASVARVKNQATKVWIANTCFPMKTSTCRDLADAPFQGKPCL